MSRDPDSALKNASRRVQEGMPLQQGFQLCAKSTMPSVTCRAEMIRLRFHNRQIRLPSMRAFRCPNAQPPWCPYPFLMLIPGTVSKTGSKESGPMK